MRGRGTKLLDAEFQLAWHKKTPQSRVPMVWIELALRVPDHLEPITHALIRRALKELDLAGSGAN